MTTPLMKMTVGVISSEGVTFTDLRELTEAVVGDGDYGNIDPGVVANTLSSMTDGMWLSCLVNPKTFNRGKALKAVEAYLKATFPDHYPERDAAYED